MIANIGFKKAHRNSLHLPWFQVKVYLWVCYASFLLSVVNISSLMKFPLDVWKLIVESIYPLTINSPRFNGTINYPFYMMHLEAAFNLLKILEAYIRVNSKGSKIHWIFSLFQVVYIYNHMCYSITHSSVLKIRFRYVK